jgi:ubiquinone/menaquinone biosynthesis C-methylase UbiE
MFNMSTTTQAGQPTPERIFDTLNAYQRTAALRGALDLDLFTTIDEGASTAADVAAKLDVPLRGARIICDYLVIIGFLTKQDDRYSLAPDSAAFLSRRSPAYLGGTMKFLNAPVFQEYFRDIAAIVRQGRSVNDQSVAPDNPIWVEFARSMAPLMRMPAEFIAGLEGASSKVLDIAAGHGLFGIAIARQNPEARIFAVDWPRVLDVAKENARNAGVEARYETIPGSAFDVDFGSDYDLALLTNFLHHFDEPTNEKLLRKVHAALKPGGRAVTLEFIPNEDRVSPPGPAAFSLMMLGSTAAGDAYTFSQLDRMFRNAGFASSQLHPLPMGGVVVSRK